MHEYYCYIVLSTNLLLEAWKNLKYNCIHELIYDIVCQINICIHTVALGFGERSPGSFNCVSLSQSKSEYITILLTWGSDIYSTQNTKCESINVTGTWDALLNFNGNTSGHRQVLKDKKPLDTAYPG